MLGEADSEPYKPGDISISRPRSRLNWGIQVPDDPSQTIYVWFDALLIYLTGSGYPWSSASDMGCWPADLQIIGKDILRFHAIYLPAILRALSAPPYSMKGPYSAIEHPFARTILAHAHWTSSQKKMSKSLGNVADPLEAIEKWGADVVRFYLMRVGGRWKDDVGEYLDCGWSTPLPKLSFPDWSPAQLDKHHREIQAQLGNYFLRIASPRFSERVALVLQGGDATLDRCFPEAMKRMLRSGVVDKQRLDSILDEDGRVVDPNIRLLQTVLALPEKVHEHMATFEVGLAIGEITTVLKLVGQLLCFAFRCWPHHFLNSCLQRLISSQANKTLSDIAPWTPDTPPTLLHTTRIVALETIRIVGGCLEPFMPSISAKLKGALGVDSQVLKDHSQVDEGQDPADILWNRWTGHKIDAIRLF